MYTDGKLQYARSVRTAELSSLFRTHADWLLSKITFSINGVLNVTTAIPCALDASPADKCGVVSELTRDVRF